MLRVRGPEAGPWRQSGCPLLVVWLSEDSAGTRLLAQKGSHVIMTVHLPSKPQRKPRGREGAVDTLVPDEGCTLGTGVSGTEATEKALPKRFRVKGRKFRPKA